jgi:hypothetical protein
MFVRLLGVACAVVAFASFARHVTLAASAASSTSASIYAVAYSGRLAPVAQRIGSSFRAIPDDVVPPGRVHLIFGNRTVATLPATIEHGQARVAVPATVHLSGVDNALASATLNGNATRARRMPSANERAAVLRIAASRLKTSPSRLTVRALTALDLGGGLAIAGTLNLRGSGAKRVDHRMFFIAEKIAGSWTFTLSSVQSVTVSEPLLEETAEMLIDALDLGDGTVGVVTRIIGFDASTYAIYTRSGAGWKMIFTGGGAAN